MTGLGSVALGSSAAVAEALRRSTATDVAVVVEDDRGNVVLDVNGDAVLESNSIQKLFTAGAALVELGPGFRYRTELRAAGGDLVLTASGDPTFTGDDLARLCAAVAARGVRRVRRVVVDESRYDRQRSVPGWKDYYVPGFTGPLAALVLDRNRWRRDDAYAADPSPANAQRVVDALRGAGVGVGGTADVDDGAVAEHESAPLAEVVRGMVLDSDTFGTELLTKELGGGTTARGVAAIDAVAARLGAARAATACAVDGSGLSEWTTDTARRQVAWLRAMDQSAVADGFRRCLPVAAESGTLATRLRGTPAAGRVAAKTGTRRLHGTVNLVGHAVTVGGRRLWFAMTVTGVRTQAEAVAAVDAAAAALVAL